jgi:hypothetical protein
MNKHVDWQIWFAQGEHPYSCRYVITAKEADQGPKYSVQIRDWKAGGAHRQVIGCGSCGHASILNDHAAVVALAHAS